MEERAGSGRVERVARGVVEGRAGSGRPGAERGAVKERAGSGREGRVESDVVEGRAERG